jgi:4-carboxymuconolactone decarboxylase
MSSQMKDPNTTLQELSGGNLSVLDTLVRMTEASLQESGLDPQKFMLVRLAALTAMDAAPVSWLVNLKVGGEAGLAPEDIVSTLIAVAPVVGTARVVSAAGSIVRAIGLGEALSEGSKGDASA